MPYSTASLSLLLLSLVLALSRAQQQCKFSCPDPTKAPVQAARLPYSNGCSVPSFIQLPDFDFSTCCDQHDACYMVCGVSKELCEKDFGACLTSLCETKYDRDKSCSDTANTFVMGVRMFGCPAFMGSQQSACDCVDGSEVEGRTMDAVTKFYARFNPEKGLPEVEQTVEKNKGKKAPSMWRALFKKYPKAISIISRDGESQTPTGLGEEL
jgi:hypothetical protein